MALISCPECNKQISDTAKMCPHCGCNPSEILSKNEKSKSETINSMDETSNISSNSYTRRLKSIYLIPFVVMSIIVIAIIAIIPSKNENFRDRYPSLNDEYWCEIAYDGSWLKIEASNYNTSALLNIKTINEDLGLSETIYNDMKSTRVIDGKQTVENSIVSVIWRYTGDSLDVTYELKNPSKYSHKSEPNILSYDQCDEIEKSVLDTLQTIDERITALVFSTDEKVTVSVRVPEYNHLMFASVATEAIAELRTIFNKYELTTYSVDIMTDSTKSLYLTWMTDDLSTGIYNDSLIKFGQMTLLEVQQECGYTKRTSSSAVTTANSTASWQSTTKHPSKTTETTTEPPTVTGATIYSRPGTQYYVYGILQFGDEVEIIGHTDNSEWINLIFEGKNAYMESKYFLSTGGNMGIIINPTQQ